MRFKRPRVSSALAFILISTAWSSASGGQDLKPEYEEFLSQVSYIITSAERKEFLALADSERPEFISGFWKRRDPDPSTEENEFKDEYLGRVSKAARLFFGEGRSGWLTDRGRIYVLFGPPDQRTATSSATDPNGRCQEVWYYRDFPVVFLDRSCSGTFRLATLDLSPIADLSLARESAPKPLFPLAEKALYDFDVLLKRKKSEGSRLDALVEISIPYSAIWLSLEGGKFVTTFEVQLSLKDSQGILRWERTESYELSLTSEELKQKLKSSYQLGIPLLVEKDMEALGQGKNKLLIVLKNKKIGEEIRKTVEFSL
ncbi:MAG: GWxTD domain-containing protein [Candidatus Aminicenantales bacterium]